MSHLIALVTGATGCVGPSVVRALHSAGYSVRTFSLDPPPVGVLPPEAEVRIGDITDPAAVREAMVGVETVIHLAALLHILDSSPSLTESYEKVNVRGTASVVEAAAAAGAQRLVFFSTISVYGSRCKGPLTEESPASPDTEYARTKLDAERIVLAATRPDGTAIGTVLRLAAAYGPRIKGNYLRLLHALARGRFIPIGDGTNRRTLIFDRDVATAAVLAARHPAAPRRIFNVTDGRFHTMGEIIASICQALGRKPPRLRIPEKPARWAAGLLQDAARLAGRNPPVTRATVDKYTEDLAVSGDRIRRELGFVADYNLTRGWQETVDEMRRSDDL